MVGIVKWLRQRVVAPLCVGSNPTIHPIFRVITLGYRQAVRQWILIPSCAGSNPATLAKSIKGCFASRLWRHSQGVRQRSAKPLSPVQIRVSPPLKKSFGLLFLYSKTAADMTAALLYYSYSLKTLKEFHPHPVLLLFLPAPFHILQI